MGFIESASNGAGILVNIAVCAFLSTAMFLVGQIVIGMIIGSVIGDRTVTKGISLIGAFAIITASFFTDDLGVIGGCVVGACLFLGTCEHYTTSK